MILDGWYKVRKVGEPNYLEIHRVEKNEDLNVRGRINWMMEEGFDFEPVIILSSTEMNNELHMAYQRGLDDARAIDKIKDYHQRG